MNSKKVSVILTLVVMLVAVLIPPWGWEQHPSSGRDYGFLITGPLNPKYTALDYSINWQMLSAELLAIAIVGAISYVVAKK